MLNKPFLSLRRISACASMLFLAGSLCVGAHAQATPTIASFAAGLNPGSGNSKIGPSTIPNIAIDTFGDVLAVDDVNGALYEFPANGGAAVALITSGGLAGASASPITPGIAIDSSNNLYIEGGSCVLMYPYAGWSTWGQTPIFYGAAGSNSAVTTASACGATGVSPTFINFGSGALAWGIAIDGSSLLVGTSSSSGNSIVSVPVTGGWTAPVAGTPVSIITGMGGAAISVAADPSGNIYFVESGADALPGAYEIPAGQTGLTSEPSTAISPTNTPTKPNVTGVATDSAGDVYISDSANGLYLLPQGSITSTSVLLLTSVIPEGSAAFSSSGTLFVPTAETAAGVDEVTFNAAQFASLAVGAAKPESGTVTFSFNNATGITPGTIEVLEAGKSTPDFSIVNSSSNSTACSTSAGSTPPPPYTAQMSCTVNLAFAPQAAGAVSASLTMLDQNGNTIASIPLNGIGIGAAVQVSPAGQSTIGGSLSSPSQIAVDAAGNLYIADAGLGKVEMYSAAASSSGGTATSVGQNLQAPTGVAVDGAGDVFIADSGNIYEVPETANGLNSAGQITLKTPTLSSHVLLAADSIGDLYISDVGNSKVYELEDLSAGSNAGLPAMLNTQILTLSGAAVAAPTVIATDSQNNLYVANSNGSVYEVTPAGTQTQILSGLSNITGLAVDPSGSVYVSQAGGMVRIPDISGTLIPANETTVASGVSNPISAAVDSMGNVYTIDGTALNVNLTSSSASVNFGTVTADPPNAGSSTQQTVTLLNYGNAPLLVTGYDSLLNYFEPYDPETPNPDATGPNDQVPYNEADFNATSDTCTGNSVPVDSTCTATITFSPAPGDGGSLAEQVLVEGNVSNSPVGVNGTGVAPTLAGSGTTMTVSTKGTIEGVPVSVTVAPNASGSPTPTGTVTLTVQYGKDVPLINCVSCTYSLQGNATTALPQKYQLTATLNNGTATFDPIELPIAHYTFTARYNGDTTYTYANSLNSGAVAVATPVQIGLTQPTINASALNTPPASPAQLEPYTLPCTSGTPSNCTTSYSLGQPSDNRAGYLVVGGLCTGCSSSWGYDGSDAQWIYKYDTTIASASGDTMVGLAAFGGGTSRIGWNYGSVNHVQLTGSSLCGNQAGSSSIVNLLNVVNDPSIQLSTFPATCGPIMNTNTTVPVFMAFYTFTPVYSSSYNDLTESNPNYYQPSTVKGSPVNIWSVSHPVVQISSSPSEITVTPGSPAQATLTVSSVLGYGYIDRGGTGGGNPNYAMPLALQCQGLPAYASCSFSYPSPNPADAQATSYAAGNLQNTDQAFPAFGGLLCQNSNPSSPSYCAFDVGPTLGSAASHASSTTPCDATTDGCLGPAQVVMTITTNVPVGTVSSAKTYKDGIAFAGLFGLTLFGLGFRKRASRLGWLMIVGFVLLAGGALTSITACSTTTLGTTSTGVTPSGSYWVTVTANQVGSSVIKTSTGSYLVYANGNQMSLPYTVYVTIK